MSVKGDETRRMIRAAASRLFAERGFKDVTMKDICECTGLSRGGLYRHYGSTGQIFQSILAEFLEKQEDEFAGSISRGEPAARILETVLERYEREMLDGGSSLSAAIFEFFSDPRFFQGDNFLSRQYQASREMWLKLLRYGMEMGEFRRMEPQEVFDLIVFSYQGVRMYSRLMPVPAELPGGILRQIRKLVLREER